MLPFIPLYYHLFSNCFVCVARSLFDFGEVAIVIEGVERGDRCLILVKRRS
jgi:hypothetical protein